MNCCQEHITLQLKIFPSLNMCYELSPQEKSKHQDGRNRGISFIVWMTILPRHETDQIKLKWLFLKVRVLGLTPLWVTACWQGSKKAYPRLKSRRLAYNDVGIPRGVQCVHFFRETKTCKKKRLLRNLPKCRNANHALSCDLNDIMNYA